VDALAGLILLRLNPADGAIVHVAASAVAGDLAGRLGAGGFPYRRAVLYGTQTADRLSSTARDAMAAGTLDGVVLYSPRTAETFQRLVLNDGLAPHCETMVAFALSGAVADAVGRLSWSRTVVADHPEQPAMIAAILIAART
jgi:uroporphyrinogen-III synthase